MELMFYDEAKNAPAKQEAHSITLSKEGHKIGIGKSI